MGSFSDNWDQFEKYQSNLLGLPYDYDSIMHYGWNYFANDRSQPTIVPKKKANIGNRKAMSPIDVKKINILYECSGSKSPSSSSSSGFGSRPSSSGSGSSRPSSSGSSSGHRSIWDILLGRDNDRTSSSNSGSGSGGSNFQASATSRPRATDKPSSGFFGFLGSIFGWKAETRRNSPKPTETRRNPPKPAETRRNPPKPTETRPVLMLRTQPNHALPCRLCCVLYVVSYCVWHHSRAFILSGQIILWIFSTTGHGWKTEKRKIAKDPHFGHPARSTTIFITLKNKNDSKNLKIWIKSNARFSEIFVVYYDIRCVTWQFIHSSSLFIDQLNDKKRSQKFFHQIFSQSMFG